MNWLALPARWYGGHGAHSPAPLSRHSSRGPQALLPHRGGSGVSEAKARPPASRLGELDQPPRPSFSPRCKAHSSPPHTNTSLSAAPTSHNLSSRRLLRADTAIPTPPLPRPPVAQVGGSSAGGGGEVAWPSSSHTRGRTRTSRPRLPAAPEAAPPTPHAQNGAASRCPLTPRVAPRGAEPSLPRRALCPAGRARRGAGGGIGAAPPALRWLLGLPGRPLWGTLLCHET